jgi:diguanylate cyclase (GGDEF)-like protein
LRPLYAPRRAGRSRPTPYVAWRPVENGLTHTTVMDPAYRGDEPYPEVDLGARRRSILLCGLVALPSLAALAGATRAWPLYAVAVALAMPLAGRRGLALVTSITALAFALIASDPSIDGLTLGVALVGFVALGGLIGAGHEMFTRELGRVSEQSLTDRLTGLPNFAFFADALPREVRRTVRYGGQVSLVIFDVDRFKRFNDQHGHDAGNRMLALVGDTITQCSRSSDIAARFGGEEFALIVPGPAEEAVEAAERIRTAVAEIEIEVSGGRRVTVTISAGVAEHLPGDASDGSMLIERADRALYAAKAAGRDRVRLSEEEDRIIGVVLPGDHRKAA